MAIDFREGWISFGPATGRRQRSSTTVNFGGAVRAQQAALKGYNIKYDNGDHHLLEVEVDLDSSANGNSVTVAADFVLRDSSGTFDDPYTGWVNFVVMADVA